ncbi:MAG: serine/threonine protein kinase, partial [Myxococcales bacterium]|nr:serine/threonine protein kinase [Myxococcales bacterium]
MANLKLVAPIDSSVRLKAPERVGPYTIHDEIGCGGMASVHLGKLRSPSGFTRIVAIKRMHSDLARSPEFVAMFFEEARLIARIHHPNVVAALDCVAVDSTAMLVMDYVHGVSLDQLMRQLRGELLPEPIVSAILVGAALGLHAAHEAVDEHGKNLGIVHRDVSPHNILVGVDGLPRVLDFGIAKAAERAQHTRTGEVKGKIGYMAPEQLFQNDVRREADIYSLGVIMWELVTGRRLFANDSHGQMMMRIANSVFDPPRSVNPSLSPEIEAVVMKALSRQPDARYRTALEFAKAIEACMPPAYQRALGEWITETSADEPSHRSEIRSRIDISMPGRPREGVVDESVITSRLRIEPAGGTGSMSVVAPTAAPQRRRMLIGAGALGALTIVLGALGLSHALAPSEPAPSASATVAQPAPPAATPAASPGVASAAPGVTAVVTPAATATEATTSASTTAPASSMDTPFGASHGLNRAPVLRGVHT